MSNSSCRTGLCPAPRSPEAAAICIEPGAHGSCSFTATQPSYRFFAYQQNTTDGSTDRIAFSISHSTPLLTGGPARLALVGSAGTAVATTLATIAERDRGKGRSSPQRLSTVPRTVEGTGSVELDRS